jgi:hypothetical protein
MLGLTDFLLLLKHIVPQINQFISQEAFAFVFNIRLLQSIAQLIVHLLQGK